MDLQGEIKTIITSLENKYPNCVRIEDLPIYENKIVSLFMNKFSSVDDLKNSKIENIFDEDCDDQIKFAVLFGLSSFYRRKKEYEQNNIFLNKYVSLFDEMKYPIINHLIFLNLMSSQQNDFEYLIEIAEENCLKFPEHYGVLHAYADTVASEGSRIYGGDNVYNYVQEALDKVEQAIKMNKSYAKYYRTKGILLGLETKKILDEIEKDKFIQITDRKIELEKKLNNAEYYVYKAIRMEPSSESDYGIRLMDYRTVLFDLKWIRTQIEMEVNRFYISKDLEEEKQYRDDEKQTFQNEIKEMQVHYLELLGLFATILTFTLGSYQIASAALENGLIGACGLILTSMGLSMLVYLNIISFTNNISILKKHKDKLIMSIIIIILGVALCVCFSGMN